MDKSETPRKKGFISRVLRWTLLWVILPVLLIHVAILIFHPEQQMMDKLFQKIQTVTGVRISYENIQVTSGFSLKFKKLVVDQPEARDWLVKGRAVTLPAQRYFSSDTFTVGIAYKPLIKGKIGLTFTGEAYQGVIDGIVETDISNAFKNSPAPLSIRPVWTGIQLSELAHDIDGLEYDKGVTSGHGDLFLNPAIKNGLSGKLSVKVENTDYAMPEKVGGALNLSVISGFKAEIGLDGADITLEEVWAYADFGSILVTGTIHQEDVMENTRLNLEVKIYPHEAGQEIDLTQYIPVTVNGTVGKPGVFFMGINIAEGL